MRLERHAAPKFHPALHIDVFSGRHRLGGDLFERQRRISVGRSIDSSVTLPDESAPPSLPLFHRGRDGYYLHYDADTHGEVTRTIGGTPRDLWQMHAASHPHHGGWDLALEAGAHGELRVGKETLQFEIVEAPDLPRAYRRFLPWIAFGMIAAAGVAGAATLFYR